MAVGDRVHPAEITNMKISSKKITYFANSLGKMIFFCSIFFNIYLTVHTF